MYYLRPWHRLLQRSDESLLKVRHGLLASHDWQCTELVKNGEEFGV